MSPGLGGGTFQAVNPSPSASGQFAGTATASQVIGNLVASTIDVPTGDTTTGFHVTVDGAVLVVNYIELVELAAAPSAPATNHARLYLLDNGAGKTQLCIIYATGAGHVLDTQT